VNLFFQDALLDGDQLFPPSRSSRRAGCDQEDRQGGRLQAGDEQPVRRIEWDTLISSYIEELKGQNRKPKTTGKYQRVPSAERSRTSFR
jgi:hypothetical protein